MSSVEKDDYRQDIDKAFELNSKRDIAGAADILREILQHIPDDDDISLGLAGTLLREAGDFENAVDAFRRVAAFRPDSERGSLGLFLSLWRLERYDEALDELVRFISRYGSEDHDLLLSEMNEGFFDSKPAEFARLELVERIREALSRKGLEHRTSNGRKRS